MPVSVPVSVTKILLDFYSLRPRQLQNNSVLGRAMDWFIRRENIKHYRSVLETTIDKAEREKLKRLLAEEEARGLGRVFDPLLYFPTSSARKAKQPRI